MMRVAVFDEAELDLAKVVTCYLVITELHYIVPDLTSNIGVTANDPGLRIHETQRCRWKNGSARKVPAELNRGEGLGTVSHQSLMLGYMIVLGTTHFSICL
jgi:hypothetical protein